MTSSPSIETGIDIPVHPVAALFPMMEGDAFSDLLEDIKAHGQQIPCIVLNGVLIDGRNRWRACRKLNKEPRTEPYSGLENHVGDYILSLNIARRHLDEGQIAVITTKACQYLEEEAEIRRNGTQFRPGESANPGGKLKSEVEPNSVPPERDLKKKVENSTAGRVAKKAGISRHKAQQAIDVVKNDPALADQVASGKVKLKDAAATVRKKRAKVKPTPPEPPATPPESKETAPAGIPAAWSLPRFGDKLRTYLALVISEVPAEHQAEAKLLAAKIAAEVFAPSDADAKPEPWGSRSVIPPMPEWVTAYSASIGYPMNGQAWCDQYGAKGWIVGKTKMKDWQAACRNWRANNWGLGTITLSRVKRNDVTDYSKI